MKTLLGVLALLLAAASFPAVRSSVVPSTFPVPSRPAQEMALAPPALPARTGSQPAPESTEGFARRPHPKPGITNREELRRLLVVLGLTATASSHR